MSHKHLFSRCKVLKFKDLVDLYLTVSSGYLIKVNVYVPLDPNANMYEIVFEQILRHIVDRLLV